MLKNNPFLIAEIGINHNGDINIVKQLIDQAVDTGFDAVKFQKRTIDIVYTRDVLDTPRESPWGTTQRQQKEGLEFGKKEYDIIDAYCKEKNIDWFCSAWDLESQKFLKQYNLKYNKLASAMTTYLPLVEIVAAEKKHTFVSVGMCSDQQVRSAVEIFRRVSCPFTLMHTVSTYPAKEEELNLNAIKTLRETYQCDVGYSGHEVGVAPSVIAVVLGATVIERHITLDRAMYGSDQAASLERKGCELLVRDCRRVQKTLGDGNRRILDAELSVAKKLRWFDAPEAKIKAVG